MLLSAVVSVAAGVRGRFGWRGVPVLPVGWARFVAFSVRWVPWAVRLAWRWLLRLGSVSVPRRWVVRGRFRLPCEVPSALTGLARVFLCHVLGPLRPSTPSS